MRALNSELVRIDMHVPQNLEIYGVELQQSTLFGYKTREYLFENWVGEFGYCDTKGIPLQIEHSHSKAQGGSARTSNRAQACQSGNQGKGTHHDNDILANIPKRLKVIVDKVEAPLRDAAAVKPTCWTLPHAPQPAALQVEIFSGVSAKFNSGTRGTSAVDFACVAAMEAFGGSPRPMVTIKAMDGGCYQRLYLDKYSFPPGYLIRIIWRHGLGTRDIPSAVALQDLKAGVHIEHRVVKAKGLFNKRGLHGGNYLLAQGIGKKHCRIVQCSQSYYDFFRGPSNRGRVQGRTNSQDATHPALYRPGVDAEAPRAF